MRSAADADSNIGLSKSQSFLPSELRDAKVIDNTVDQDHRGGLPPRDRDTNPLRPDARTLAAIAGNPTHPPHGVTTFGLGTMNKRLSALMSSMPFTELEAARSELSRNNCLTTGTSTPKLTRRSRKLSGTLTPLPCTVRLRKATSEKARSPFKTSSANIKAHNLKEFRLNISTTHASGLCEYASYQAYITGSNKIFYLHEYFKAAVLRDVETLDLLS